MNGLMTISTISDYRVLLEEVFEEFVQEYQLDHGGAWIEFDIDDYFDEKWSPEFGRENYLRPSQYIKQLQEDKAYLIQIYHEIVGQ